MLFSSFSSLLFSSLLFPFSSSSLAVPSSFSFSFFLARKSTCQSDSYNRNGRLEGSGLYSAVQSSAGGERERKKERTKRAEKGGADGKARHGQGHPRQGKPHLARLSKFRPHFGLCRSQLGGRWMKPQTKKKNRPDSSCAHAGSQTRALATAAPGPSAARLAQRGWQEREILCYGR
jgi:hypothetical protein